MTIARLSIFKALPGKKEELEKLLDEFEEFVSKEKGYISGFRFEATENTNEVGRISLWENQQQADHVATMDHVVVLRNRIHRLIMPGHTEKILVVKGKPKNFPIKP